MLKKDWIVIKFSTLKQTPVILKIFPLECISNRVSIYICLQSNKYVKFIEWMSEDSIFKVFRFQRKTLLFSYGTFFVIMLIIIFFHEICPGNFSETIRPISKIFSGMIGIYLKFIPYWDFWKYHFRFRVRVHFLTFYDPFCARKFSKTIKDIELKFSG